MKKLATKKVMPRKLPIVSTPAAKAPACAIYARVSTDDQNNALQLTELRAYAKRMGWTAIEYTEQVSSMKQRAQFDRLMEDARLRRIDVILVWKLDRFARSMQQLTTSIQLLDSYGVRFIAITQSIDTDQKNPMSRLIMHIMGAFAEFERNLIVERTRAGMAEAKRAGKHCGRPHRVLDRAKLRELADGGMSLRSIARELGVGFMTVSRQLKREPAAPETGKKRVSQNPQKRGARKL